MNSMDELIKKISEIFFRYGIKSVTMDDLASELGLSKKTLYLHFKDKEDLVGKVVRFMIDRQQCSIGAMVNDEEMNAIDQLFHMSRFITAHLQEVSPAVNYDIQKYYPNVWEELLSFKRQTLFEHIMENYHKGVREGLFLKDIRFEIIASVYVSRMEFYSGGVVQGLEKYSFGELFNTLFVYHIRGVANEKGLAYLDQLIANNTTNQ